MPDFDRKHPRQGPFTEIVAWKANVVAVINGLRDQSIGCPQLSGKTVGVENCRGDRSSGVEMHFAPDRKYKVLVGVRIEGELACVST